MIYVDGFVLPVPTANLDAYKRLSRRAGKIWREHGALEYRECVLDDSDAKSLVPFPTIATAKPGETVTFAWITYKSRAHRNKVNAKVMADKRLKDNLPGEMPFDCSRMAYGGFKSIVEK